MGTAIVETGNGYGYRKTRQGTMPSGAERRERQGLTPTAAGQDSGRSGGVAAAHPTPPVVGGGGLGTAPQGKKTT